MELSVLIAGFGGQGVLSIGKLLCYAADADGKKPRFFLRTEENKEAEPLTALLYCLMKR